MTQTHENIIKDIASEILFRAGFPDVHITVHRTQDGEKPFFACDLRMETDSQFLIGQHGVNLRALQHLLRIIVRKKIGESNGGLIVDVNGYQKEHQELLIQKAREAAAQAVREHEPVILSALSAYERRVIHMELAQRNDIHTESVGAGEDRRVIVHPRNVGE